MQLYPRCTAPIQAATTRAGRGDRDNWKRNGGLADEGRHQLEGEKPSPMMQMELNSCNFRPTKEDEEGFSGVACRSDECHRWWLCCERC